VQQVAWLTKGQIGVAPWTEKALQALFSDEVIKNKRNTAAIEVAPNTLLAARILEHKPASTMPFADVAGAIRQKLLRQQAQDMAVKQGQALLAQLQRGDKVSVEWKPAQAVTRSQHGGIDNDMARLVFTANVTNLPVYAGKESMQGGYTLARIDAVKEVGEIDEAKRARYVQQLRKMTGDELLQSYLADAKKNASIKMRSFSTEEQGK
jgi:peptidyl-prolyl cis-trans isomerase D